jgi:hypothetical protein
MLGSDNPAVVRDTIKKKEIRISLTGCHWVNGIITHFLLIGSPMPTG